MKLIEPDEMHRFEAVLAQHRLSPDDFELRETDTTDPKTDEILALTGFVKIARKSTGKHREYPTGDGSHWVEDFQRDLAENLFE